MKILEFLFSEYKWFRKWRGGIWYRIACKHLPEIKVWIRIPNPEFETVLEKEDYTPV